MLLQHSFFSVIIVSWIPKSPNRIFTPWDILYNREKYLGITHTHEYGTGFLREMLLSLVNWIVQCMARFYSTGHKLRHMTYFCFCIFFTLSSVFAILKLHDFFWNVHNSLCLNKMNFNWHMYRCPINGTTKRWGLFRFA